MIRPAHEPKAPLPEVLILSLSKDEDRLAARTSPEDRQNPFIIMVSPFSDQAL